MSMPNIDEANRKRPLSYDPTREKFIFFDEIVAGVEKIVPLSSLSEEDIKKLVIERQRTGPDYAVQPISGPRATRDDVIRAIETDEPFGKMAVQAERMYLDEFLAEIQQNL